MKRLADCRRDVELLAGDPKSRKDLECLALEQELENRDVKISVKVNSTEDWLGADHVYVKVAGASTHHQGQGGWTTATASTSSMPLGALAPTLPKPRGPIGVEVYDQDWPDADDLIVKMTWAPPYAAAEHLVDGDADYSVTVSYER